MRVPVSRAGQRQRQGPEIARLRTELQEVRAELVELRRQHAELIDSLAALTVSAYAPDGTVLGSMPLLDELLRPGGDRHLRMAVPAPDWA
jgi:hypothetical protein